MRTSSSKDSNMETRFLGTISASSIRKLLPRSLSSSSTKHKTSKNPNCNSENDPPIDPNIQIDLGQTSPVVPKLKPSDVLSSKHEIARSDVEKQASVPSDPPVKVVVRIKPANDGERDGDRTVKKVSSDTVSVGDRRFTFDSVFDSKANQEDVFQLVGIPLVKNALAGYNTSIVSYGQSGSGKTYTMWGPPSAMVEDPSPRSHQGIVPRTFQMLFSEIDKERENSEGKQINYQFRCSFLEIYNEQIGDLLDPTQRNLEIKDDPKNGLCVENLTEEYVTSYEDVMQILIKGLSSRKVGATSVNSKSSRSHIVFTFVIESWCKGTSSKCFGSSKTCRISLVDLAGLDRNKVDDEGRQSAREGKSVKKSLSRLGHVVNSLATKGPLSGKHEDSLYRGSCLTHLLRESLGGNSKLTVICAISPDKNNDSEILRTLRFGERMKSVRNDPVVNEITEDDVNDLSDQIRQLKEELIRAKSSASSNSVGSNYGHFRGRNVRESLNQLRVSLNRSLILPRIDIDSDEEVNVDEHDVNELRKQLDELHNFHEEISGDLSLDRHSIQLGENCETDLMSEDDTNCPEETESEEINPQTYQDELPLMENIALTHKLGGSPKTSGAKNPEFRSSISISSCGRPQILQEPTMSESPKIGKNQRKSVTISSSHSVNRNNVSESSKLNSEVLRQSLSQSEHIRSSLQSNKIFPGPTESLAASLQRGLQIIDCHQRNSASNKPSVAFSFEHLTLKPCPEVDNTSASGTLLCASCRRQIQEKDSSDVQDSLKTWIVAMDEAGNPMTEEATKDAKNSMAAVTKREELENRCKEQEAKIEQLNQLIEQYNRNSTVENGQESSSHCLLSSKHEIIPFEEPKDQDIHVLKDENKLLRCNSLDNHHPEMIKENYEIKEVQNESTLEYGNTIFEVNEKETLLKEIQFLRRKLQLQNDGSPNKSTEKLRSSLLSRSIQLRKSFAHQNFNEEELERERQRWTEMESDWISLTDELRIDLDAHRRRAEKVEMELKLEKQCTEELDDALHRAVLSHARFVEHYAELQEKYNDLVGKHRAIMEGIAEVKRAATKAGKKGRGPRFAKSLAAELSAMRVERERERELLKKENKSLRIQLRDTAEAVHAAGELLVRLREAEHAASVAEENFANMQQDNEKLKKQMEKLKRKHKMEMVTMKQYLAESKLPESALQPLYQDDSDMAHHTTIPGDDQAWRAEFGAIYQDHY